MACTGDYPSQLHPSQRHPTELKEMVRHRWSGFLDACEQHHIDTAPEALPTAFRQQLERVWIGSDFAFEQSLKRPDLVFNYLENPTLLEHSRSESHHQRVAQRVSRCTTETELMHLLRRYRNREMVRIIWRDLNRLATMEETTADLSFMADACIDKALTWLYDDACTTLGVPMGGYYGQAPFQQQLVVLGMGKLGARELNLSSDIDLIFCYPCQGDTLGSKRPIENQQFFLRLGQRLIKVLDNQTADGFVFRVDMRLRPYGNSGALAMCFSAMEQYYQDQGRDWERYAMIKARVVAGDKHQGQQLLSTLRPFTYRKYLDFSAISALRDMKSLIKREVKRKGMDSNIKLGSGGIREIEFIVQSFQLIHGGRDRTLQKRNLLTVLDNLRHQGYLPATSVAELKAAYIYLRNLEHGIQALQDRQTQQLPPDDNTLLRLSVSMGHHHSGDMMSVLNQHRRNVAQHFIDVIADPDASPEEQTHCHNWHLLWSGTLTDEEAKTLLQERGYTDSEQSLHLLQALRDGKAITRVRRQSRDRLDAFIPRLLEQCSQASQPDNALARVLPLVESVLRRTSYLVLLIENPAALKHLIKLCIASPWIAGQIARYPALLDEFLNIKDLYNPPGPGELEDDLSQQLAHLPEDDLETQMEVLRHFKMTHVLKVAAAQAAGTLPLMKESDYLTWIAGALLDQVISIAWRNLIKIHGRPVRADGSHCEPGFAIVGYGKLGGIELGPGSDLDLVFIHEGGALKETDGPRPLDSQTFYTRLGQRIIHILTTQTSSGRLYEVDMRLRPSGNSGLLVSSLDALDKYQNSEAWVWEHQALVRARAVAGDQQLMDAFEVLRQKVLCQPRDRAALREEVTKMRLKMHQHLSKSHYDEHGELLFHLKHHTGGIIDIEFLMQYAVLAYASKHKSIAVFSDNIRISESLERAGLLCERDAKALREAYQFLRKEHHCASFQNAQPCIDMATAQPYTKEVHKLWDSWLGNDGSR